MSTALSNTLKDRKNQIQTSNATPQALLKNSLVKNINTFKSVFSGNEVKTKSFLAKVTAAAVSNPDIMECSIESLVAAAIKCATLNLDPNPYLGLTWFVPYWNGKKNCKEVQFQIGATGYKVLALRSVNVLYIRADIVKQKDAFSHSKTLSTRIDNNIVMVEEHLEHKPAESGRGESTHFYAEAILREGDTLLKVHNVMSLEDAMAYKKHAKTDFVWKQFPDEMCLKTVLKHFCKDLPLSTDIQEELINDNAVLKMVKNDDDNYVIEIDEPEINYKEIAAGNETRVQTTPEDEAREKAEQEAIRERLKQQHQANQPAQSTKPAQTKPASGPQSQSDTTGQTEEKISKDKKHFEHRIAKAQSLDELNEIQEEIRGSSIRTANKDDLYSIIRTKKAKYEPSDEDLSSQTLIPEEPVTNTEIIDVSDIEMPDDLDQALGL